MQTLPPRQCRNRPTLAKLSEGVSKLCCNSALWQHPVAQPRLEYSLALHVHPSYSHCNA